MTIKLTIERLLSALSLPVLVPSPKLAVRNIGNSLYKFYLSQILRRKSVHSKAWGQAYINSSKLLVEQTRLTSIEKLQLIEDFIKLSLNREQSSNLESLIDGLGCINNTDLVRLISQEYPRLLRGDMHKLSLEAKNVLFKNMAQINLTDWEQLDKNEQSLYISSLKSPAQVGPIEHEELALRIHRATHHTKFEAVIRIHTALMRATANELFERTVQFAIPGTQDEKALIIAAHQRGEINVHSFFESYLKAPNSNSNNGPRYLYALLASGYSELSAKQMTLLRGDEAFKIVSKILEQFKLEEKILCPDTLLLTMGYYLNQILLEKALDHAVKFGLISYIAPLCKLGANSPAFYNALFSNTNACQSAAGFQAVLDKCNSNTNIIDFQNMNLLADILKNSSNDSLVVNNIVTIVSRLIGAGEIKTLESLYDKFSEKVAFSIFKIFPEQAILNNKEEYFEFLAKKGLCPFSYDKKPTVPIEDKVYATYFNTLHCYNPDLIAKLPPTDQQWYLNRAIEFGCLKLASSILSLNKCKIYENTIATEMIQKTSVRVLARQLKLFGKRSPLERVIYARIKPLLTTTPFIVTTLAASTLGMFVLATMPFVVAPAYLFLRELYSKKTAINNRNFVLFSGVVGLVFIIPSSIYAMSLLTISVVYPSIFWLKVKEQILGVALNLEKQSMSEDVFIADSDNNEALSHLQNNWTLPHDLTFNVFQEDEKPEAHKKGFTQAYARGLKADDLRTLDDRIVDVGDNPRNSGYRGR